MARLLLDRASRRLRGENVMEGIPETLVFACLCEELVAMLGTRVPGDHRAASEVASVFLFTAQSEKCIHL